MQIFFGFFYCRFDGAYGFIGIADFYHKVAPMELCGLAKIAIFYHKVAPMELGGLI